MWDNIKKILKSVFEVKGNPNVVYVGWGADIPFCEKCGRAVKSVYHECNLGE